jgi:ornithine carbamoyltransferase
MLEADLVALSKGEAVRHLLSISDLPDEALRDIVAAGVRIATAKGRQRDSLDGVIIGMLFRQTSTRTRTAFSSGALRLGARIVTFQPADLQTNTGETLADTARVLSLMLDALVVRTASDASELRVLAGPDDAAVINAMDPAEHPTQALADLTAMAGHFGHIEGLKVLYVGEGNNTAAALALAMSRYPGVRLELRTPPGYGLPQPVLDQAAGYAGSAGATVTELHHMRDLPDKSDVIYTTRWQTTGTAKPDPDWRELFTPFTVNASLWDGSPDAVFMHDLPAHRGDEVTAEVLDGPRSIAFTQAGCKLYSAMAVLEWCCGEGRR